MGSIYLKKTTRYGSGEVKQENYDICPLFTRYKHYSTGKVSPGKIWVYNEYNSGFGRYLTLHNDGIYNTYPLTHEHVYFNKYDNTNTPLLLVLFFQGGNKHAKNRWYKYSDLSPLINKSGHSRIDSLNVFTDQGDVQILDTLFQENNRLDGILTYDIGKKQGDGRTNRYNNNKIEISSFQDQPAPGFTKYHHKPSSSNRNTDKKACVVYNKNVPMGENTQLPGIQDQTFIIITVYFGDKSDKDPLLVGFEKKGTRGVSSWEYYFLKKGKNITYWELLDERSSQNLIGSIVNRNTVHNDLTGSSDLKLINLLKKLEFIISNSVILLIEKTRDYVKRDVESAFKTIVPQIIPKPESTYVQPENIKVQESSCNFLKEKGYKIFIHEIIIDNSKLSSSIKRGDKIEFRILLPGKGTDKYNEVKLYNSGGIYSEGNRVFLVYTKNNDVNIIKLFLYVYFYGDDPRPLLICFENKIYKPDTKDKYFDKWANVSTISKCACSPNNKDDELLTVLTEVAGLLNSVELQKISTQSPYTVQTFNGRNIEINIETTKVEPTNNSCYSKMLHTPVGTDRNMTGFRLGHITYNKSNTQIGNIGYSSGKNKYYPLVKVIAYFYEEDSQHNDPILVELEFKVNGRTGIKKEYYKLVTREESSMIWQIEEDQIFEDSNKLVTYLDQTRYRVKKPIKIRIDKRIQYNLMMSKQPGNIEGEFQRLGNADITVSEEYCENLNNSNYKCYRHKISDFSPTEHPNDVGGLKIAVPQRLLKDGDNGLTVSEEDISLYNIKPGRENDVKQKISSNTQVVSIIQDLESRDSLYYKKCMGDVYTYFYHPNKVESQGVQNDPRPLLICFNGMGYRPIKLPQLSSDNYDYTDEDYTTWVYDSRITKCGCEDENPIIQILNEIRGIYNNDTATSVGTSVGTVLGVGAIGTGVAAYKYPEIFLSLLSKIMSR